MKKIKYLLIAITICLTNISNATILLLNNNSTGPGYYNTLQAAYNATASGDTIYVSGSPTSYGDITIGHYITFIGTGFNPQKQFPYKSTLGNITFTTYNFGGTFIGLSFNYIEDSNELNKSTINVKNCQFNYFRGNKFLGGNYNIENSVFITFTLNNGLSSVGSGIDCPITLKNNLIYGRIYSSTFNGGVENGNIESNIFIDTTNSSLTDFSNSIYKNTTFKNNIFLNRKPSCSNIESSTCNFYFNCAYPLSQVFTEDDGNNIVANPLFVNYSCLPSPCSYDFNQDFHLQPSSPCIGSGFSGNDIGIYGNLSTFSMSGEPPIPQIKQLNVPAKVVSGQNFSVNIISTVK